ncbi:hypothetical protein OQA88_11346 [Cercophora sp. LCS_1]
MRSAVRRIGGGSEPALAHGQLVAPARMASSNEDEEYDSDTTVTMREFEDHVDVNTFSQILEMDEESHDFSMPLVVNFFEQADETFEKMDLALEASDLGELSRLGHFLKGSSATLGFTKIKDSCQIIQQYGHHLNVDGSPEADDSVCLKRITEALKAVKVDKEELKKKMDKFFRLDE